jgi:hypothetical protein
VSGVVPMPAIGRTVTRRDLDRLRAQLVRENGAFGPTLQLMPRAQWPTLESAKDAGGAGATLVGVWRSRTFLAMLFHEGRWSRLSVIRTRLRDDGRWEDGVTWDELQACKREAGFGAWWGLEVYPADDAVVNVANMRHLWLFDVPPPFGWSDARVER